MLEDNKYDMVGSSYDLFVKYANYDELKAVEELLEKEDYDKAWKKVNEFVETLNMIKDFKDTETVSSGAKSLTEGSRSELFVMILQLLEQRNHVKNEQEKELLEGQIDNLSKRYFNEYGVSRGR